MNARVPRVHGNGFVQLDLTPSVRLHVWGDPRIPKQTRPTPIHDHMFGFTSRVLLGCMGNRRFQARPSPADHTDDYMVHHAQVRDREDTVLVPTGDRVWLQEFQTRWYYPGQAYQMAVGELHESVIEELTVTIIEKWSPTLAQGGPSPRIFVPVGIQPDNEFRRYDFEEDLLWQIIAEAMLKARAVEKYE